MRRTRSSYWPGVFSTGWSSCYDLLVQFHLGVAAVPNCVVADNVTVLERDNALTILRDIGLMSYQDDADSLLVVARLKDRHDLDAGTGIERPCRLVGKDDPRIVDQTAGNRHALLLSTGELIGMMTGAFRQAHNAQRIQGALVIRVRAIRAIK